MCTVQGLASAFECGGAGLAVVLNTPQAWRSCHGRRVEGLSPAARWLAVLQSATWVAFGLTGGGAVQVVSNLVCGALHLSVLAALLRLSPAARARRLLVPQATASAVWLCVVLWAATTGLLPVGLLAAACATVGLVPQLVLLARSDDTRGVSPVTARLTVLCCGSWTAAGTLTGSAAVWLPSGLGLLAAVATLGLLRTGTPGTVPAITGALALPVPRAATHDLLAVPAH